MWPMNANREPTDAGMRDRYNAFLSACSSPLLAQGKSDAAFAFMEVEDAAHALSKQMDSLQNAMANVDRRAPQCWRELCGMVGHLQHMRRHCREAIAWLESTCKRLESLPEVQEALELDGPGNDCDSDTPGKGGDAPVTDEFREHP